MQAATWSPVTVVNRSRVPRPSRCPKWSHMDSNGLERNRNQSANPNPISRRQYSHNQDCRKQNGLKAQQTYRPPPPCDSISQLQRYNRSIILWNAWNDCRYVDKVPTTAELQKTSERSNDRRPSQLQWRRLRPYYTYQIINSLSTLEYSAVGKDYNTKQKYSKVVMLDLRNRPSYITTRNDKTHANVW